MSSAPTDPEVAASSPDMERASADYTLTLRGSSARVALSPAKTLLDACLSQQVAMPYNCRSGECGECAVRLVKGEIHEMPGADPAIFTQAMRETGLVLTCMAFPRSDVELDVPAGLAPQPKIHSFDAVIQRVDWLGERTAHVTVRRPEGVQFTGGQYFEWHIPGIERPRLYSAANAPGGPSMEFLVRIYPGGAVSAKLRRGEIDAGDVVPMRGPFGSYSFRADDPGTAIFVAGGTGLAPVRSIVMDALSAQGPDRQIIVFMGARDQAELAAAQELEQAALRHRKLKFVPVLSHEPADSGWGGRRGLVTDVLGSMLGDQFGAQAYLCGPAPMVEAALPILEVCGLARSDIHCDKFVPAESARRQ